MPYSRHPNVPTMRLQFVEVVMRLRSSAATFVLMIPMILGGTTKTDWSNWADHGFNDSFHENHIIAGLEAGEIIYDCPFGTTPDRVWSLVRSHRITEEEAGRLCPGFLIREKSVNSTNGRRV
jgi:hypothetical protein